MKVQAMRVSYYYEPFTIIYVYNLESGKRIGVFKCDKSKSSRKEFMKYAKAKGWEVTRTINI